MEKKQLTKEEKLKVLHLVLSDLKNDKKKYKKDLLFKTFIRNKDKNFAGLCYLFSNAYFLTFGIRENSVIGKYFPEIQKMKPINKHFFWWPLTYEGNNKRIEVVSKCIEMLENK